MSDLADANDIRSLDEVRAVSESQLEKSKEQLRQALHNQQRIAWNQQRIKQQLHTSAQMSTDLDELLSKTVLDNKQFEKMLQRREAIGKIIQAVVENQLEVDAYAIETDALVARIAETVEQCESFSASLNRIQQNTGQATTGVQDDAQSTSHQ